MDWLTKHIERSRPFREDNEFFFFLDQLILRWLWAIQVKMFKCLAGNLYAKYTDQGLR